MKNGKRLLSKITNKIKKYPFLCSKKVSKAKIKLKIMSDKKL